jgi:hypothetical protein
MEAEALASPGATGPDQMEVVQAARQGSGGVVLELPHREYG